ncbi:MAG: DinB family protein [Anaerolineae bacterium]
MMRPNEPGENSVLVVLFRHNIWANLKVLDYCETLSDEQLHAAAPGTYGSIRDTLLHIVGGEASYVRRANGKLPAEPLPKDRFPSLAALKETARWAGEELLQLALSTRANSIVEEHWPDLRLIERYSLASLMMQAINHATEHRTQISTIITQLGLEPPDTSGWQYMVETGDYQAIKEI